jgi:hypothetical protein
VTDEMSNDDVLADLEGAEAPEYKKSFGIPEGTYGVRVQDVEITSITFPNTQNKVPVARYTLEMLEPRYSNFTRNLDHFLGKNQNGEWQDQAFRQTARRLIPDEVFNREVETVTNAAARYRKAAELLKGREGRVNFRKIKKKDGTITEAAYPVGALLSPLPDEDDDTTSSDAGSI